MVVRTAVLCAAALTGVHTFAVPTVGGRLCAAALTGVHTFAVPTVGGRLGRSRALRMSASGEGNSMGGRLGRSRALRMAASGEGNSIDMGLLARRIEALRCAPAKLPLVVLGAILPRQRWTIR